MADPAPLLITRWASQAERESPALSPERAKLDSRGFPDLLAEAAHLAGLVGFQETDLAINGDWRRILAGDPAILLALLATVDVEARAEALQALLVEARQSGSRHEAEPSIRKLVEALLRFAAELDDWLGPAEAAAGIAGDSAYRLVAESIEQILGPGLRALLAELKTAEAAGLIFAILPPGGARLGPRWRLAAIEAEVLAVRHASWEAWIHGLLDRLAEVADSFVREVREISESAAAALEPSLASDTHPPHVALVMAFARIFAHAQDRLNAVPQRFADFYQSKMLRAEPRAAEPDSVFLTIVPRPGARPLVPKGALFAAGKDKKGAAIGFAADAALAVTGTALAQVRRWTPATGADGAAVRIDAAIFAAGPDGAVGAAPDGLAGAAPAVTVAPAIVLAAPLLAVVGAARRIVLTLACTGLTDAITSPSLSSSLDVSVSTAKGWLDLGAAGVSAAWTRDDSSIAVTVELGADVPPIVPCPPGSQAPDAPAIRLALRQDAADPAAQPWALFGGLGLTGATLEIAVRDLNGLEVSASSMPASAAGAAPFGLQPMPGGTLRIDHPALAAAPLDRLVLTLDWASLPPDPEGFGGYYREYVVGADRQLHDRSPFDNDSFTVTMAAPVPGWPASKILPLFAAADPVAGNGIPDPPPPDIFAAQGFAPPPPPAPLAPLAASSWFAAAAGPAAEPPPEPVPGPEDEAPQGAFYVELILAGPAEGFGDSLYNANMTYATALLAHAQVPPPGPGVLKRLGTAIASLAAKAGKAIAAAAAWVMGALKAIVMFPAKVLRGLDGIDGSDPGPAPEPAPGPPPPPPSSADPMPVLPNPPFRPILSGIRLDCAWRVSDANGVALYHETPLEGLSEAIVPAGAPLFAPLPIVPCLDIALGGARAGERQALLVRLGQPADGPASAPAYFYRTAAGWQKLPAAGALADGTGGLQANGIIAFALPPDAAPIVGADDALWLRAQFPGGTVPPIVAISADALSATRIPGGDAAVVAPVAAGTIARPPGLAGIAQVTQPLASAGGRAAEDISTLRGRVAERVRHRGRGVTGWDIERIVLDDFPAILKARVVPTGALPGSGPAGDTIVAVVPGPGGADAVDPLRPRASPQLRGAIEARLGACASPFARLRVVDPVYVAVDVEARLIVRGEPGDAIETALAALLSPWADPGLDLDDDSDGEALRAAIAFFLRSRGDVVRIEHLAVALRDAAPPAPWRVPVAGTLDILAVAAAPVISSW